MKLLYTFKILTICSKDINYGKKSAIEGITDGTASHSQASSCRLIMAVHSAKESGAVLSSCGELGAREKE